MSSPSDAENERPLQPPARPEALWGYDFKSIQHDLEEKAPDVFASEVDEVECWTTPTDNHSAGPDYGKVYPIL
jgi:hypothetical protein